jgi:hypothetical protein
MGDLARAAAAWGREIARFKSRVFLEIKNSNQVYSTLLGNVHARTFCSYFSKREREREKERERERERES